MKLPYSLKILHPSTLTAMLSWNYPVCHLFTWSLPACAPHEPEPFLGVCRISEPRMASGCRKGLRTACRRKERREETGGNVCAEHLLYVPYNWIHVHLPSSWNTVSSLYKYGIRVPEHFGYLGQGHLSWIPQSLFTDEPLQSGTGLAIYFPGILHVP